MAKYGPTGTKGAQTTGLQPIKKTPKSGGVPLGFRSSANPSRWSVSQSRTAGFPRAKGPVMKGKVRGPT
jgi:hypothetical protein